MLDEFNVLATNQKGKNKKYDGILENRIRAIIYRMCVPNGVN